MTPFKELLQQADYYKSSARHEIAITEDTIITEYTIKELHRSAEADSCTAPSDSYRTAMPADGDDGYQPPQPEDVPRLTSHLADQIRSSKSSLHPIELAAMAGKRLLDIQPFDHGNEETAFLLMNLILVSAGYSPVTIGPDRREAYQQALAISRKEYNMEPFSRLIAECILDEEKNTAI